MMSTPLVFELPSLMDFLPVVVPVVFLPMTDCTRIGMLQKEVNGLKGDVSDLKGDVSDLKGDMRSLRKLSLVWCIRNLVISAGEIWKWSVQKHEDDVGDGKHLYDKDPVVQDLVFYANQQPIRLEKVIKNFTAACVKNFYHRWYRPEHMAIVAIGDFPNTEEVVKLIKQHFEERKPYSEDKILSTIPIFLVPLHEKPHFSCFSETEAGVCAVMISCKVLAKQDTTIGDYQC